MKLTKQHFEIFAKIINKSIGSGEAQKSIITTAWNELRKFNCNGDAEKFYRACETGAHIRRSIYNS